MHPWGNNDFTEYGVVAARAALRTPADWRASCGYRAERTPPHVNPASSLRHVRPELGWTGVPVVPATPCVPAGLQSARAQILPVSVTWRRSAPTPKGAFSRPWAASARATPTGSVYLIGRRSCWRAGGWTCTVPQSRLRSGEGQELLGTACGQPERPLPQRELAIDDALASPGLGSALAALDISRHSPTVAVIVEAALLSRGNFALWWVCRLVQVCGATAPRQLAAQ